MTRRKVYTVYGPVITPLSIDLTIIVHRYPKIEYNNISTQEH